MRPMWLPVGTGERSRTPSLRSLSAWLSEQVPSRLGPPNRRGTTAPKAALASILVVVLFSCQYLDPDREAITAPGHPVRLIVVTEETRRLVVQQSDLAAQDQAEVTRFSLDFDRLYQEVTRPSKAGQPPPDKAGAGRAMLALAEAYIPERVAFLGAMARAPGVLVPGGSYCRITERSKAICSSYPQDNPEYVLVIITSGPSKGVKGWGCLGDGIGLTRTPF